MDIQNIDLRRGDFEAMHPKAKLFGFDEGKKLYTGDGVESINDQWTTWCACIGMLRLDGKESQAGLEGFVLVPKEPTDKTIARMINTPIEVNLLCDHADIFLSEGEAYIAYQAMIEAQEPTND
ncbi:hypothetical protein [Acinetobacter indicus]|uniref:hypothetical protein n=1 Tax=Acinetobacter indicus TaxID=756892 RepID=UPI000CEB637B|nr:hypothetical protein [Acinetobacter indicus]AVH14403.1 hypothetical protein CTZ23_08950 [Acinetobacter indicus]